MSGATDDFALLEAWRGGDEPAGNELVQRHFEGIYLFFRGKVSDVAEDLTQRTFLAAVEARERIDERGTVRAYLYGIARHQLFRHFRDHRRHDARLNPMERSMRDLGHSPSRVVAEREELRLLHEALERIPADLQIAIELSYWHELSATEVAAVLEIPAGTVKSRIRRAKELLREAMLTIGASEAECETTLATLEREGG